MDSVEYQNLTPQIIALKSPDELKDFFDNLYEDQFYSLKEELIQAITSDQIINTWKVNGFVLPFLNSGTRKSPFLYLTANQLYYYNITVGNHHKVIDEFTDEFSHDRIIWKEKTKIRKSYLGKAGFFDSFIESEMPSIDDGIPGGSKTAVYIPPDPPPPPPPPYSFYNPLYSDFFTWQNAFYPGIKGEPEPTEKLFSDFYAYQNILHSGIKEDTSHETPLHSEHFSYQNENHKGISENLDE
jgi:hypothetical protein